MNGKRELADLLLSWHQSSHAKTIGDVSGYGGTPWITVGLGSHEAVLNADTKRAAVTTYLEHVRRLGPELPWRVIATSRSGTVNKLVFSDDPADAAGWYLYLRKPLDQPGAAMTTASVVQFPHPGPEHKPPKDQDIMAWNTGPHRRKFLRAPGRLLGQDGDLRQTDSVFWGEYEAASRVTRRWMPSGELPTALHESIVSPPPDSPKRQNTDPWVFGSRFLYSNCKQLTPSGRPSAMQSLPRGSVILFGSQIGGRFCLDTVFVVAERIPYKACDAADLPVDDAFRICTIESLAAYEHPTIDLREAAFTLYLGATYDDPVDGMYSFTPARESSGDGPRFARPSYCDTRFVNPDSKQSPSGAKAPRPMTEVREAWEAAVQACRDHKLDLAVQVGFNELSLPAHCDMARMWWSVRRRNCIAHEGFACEAFMVTLGLYLLAYSCLVCCF